MPKKVHECANKLIAEGYPEESAWAICYASIGEKTEDAEYQGKEVTLNKPFYTPDENKKFAVYVKNSEGNVVIVRFGDPDMEIKRDDPEARKAFLSRHSCEEKKDPTTPGYWSCKMWGPDPVSKMVDKSLPALDKFIDQSTGFLHVKGRIARTGIQEYLGRELSQELEPDKLYGVLRHPDDVLDPESVEGFRNAPVTDDHPMDFVNSENYKDLMKGSCSEVTTSKDEGINYIDGHLTVMDKELVEKLKYGKLEISAGYYSDLEEEEGEYLGVPYHFRQTNIKPNHVAIVSRGRCGGSCRIINDYAIMAYENQNKGGNMAIVKIGETEYDVPEEVAAKLAELQEALKGKEEEVETMSTDMEETEKEKEAAVAMADELKEQVKALKRSTRDSAIAGEAKKIVEVMKVADSMGIECAISDEITMKQSVLKAKYPNIDLSGKSKDYIAARFDAMVEGRENAEASHKKIGEETKDGKQGSTKLADQLKEEEY